MDLKVNVTPLSKTPGGSHVVYLLDDQVLQASLAKEGRNLRDREALAKAKAAKKKQLDWDSESSDDENNNDSDYTPSDTEEASAQKEDEGLDEWSPDKKKASKSDKRALGWAPVSQQTKKKATSYREKLVVDDELTEYERIRLQNIEERKRLFEQMNFDQAKTDLKKSLGLMRTKPNKKVEHKRTRQSTRLLLKKKGKQMPLTEFQKAIDALNYVTFGPSGKQNDQNSDERDESSDNADTDQFKDQTKAAEPEPTYPVDDDSGFPSDASGEDKEVLKLQEPEGSQK